MNTLLIDAPAGELSVMFQSLLGRFPADWTSLPDKPEETPAETLRALWFAAAGMPRSLPAARSAPLPPLSDAQAEVLEQLLSRRLAGAPLAHLTGWVAFLGLDFLAAPAAMIPRRETELLGRTAIELLRATPGGSSPLRVLDLCTGSGNLALAIARQVPAAAVWGADLSESAIDLARRNARHHRLEQRVTFHAGDLFTPFEQPCFQRSFHMVVANPPYLTTAKALDLPPEIHDFEPRMAFDAGPFGLNIYTRLLTDAPRFLQPAGWLCFEVGLGHGSYLSRAARRAGVFHEVREIPNASGEVRAIAAQLR